MRTSHIPTIEVTTAVTLLLISSLHTQSPECTTMIITDHEIFDCTNTG